MDHVLDSYPVLEALVPKDRSSILLGRVEDPEASYVLVQDIWRGNRVEIFDQAACGIQAP